MAHKNLLNAAKKLPNKLIRNTSSGISKKHHSLISNVIHNEPCLTFNDDFFAWMSDAKCPKHAITKLHAYKGTPYENQYATPNVYASYLKCAPFSHFSSKQRTQYLSTCDANILYAYFKPVYFINMSLEQALRFIFTELRLKILHNTKAMNNILEALSISYLIANKTAIYLNNVSISDLLSTFNAIIMLQNGIHSIKKQKLMTEDEFMEFYQDTIFDENEMKQVYDNIVLTSLYKMS